MAVNGTVIQITLKITIITFICFHEDSNYCNFLLTELFKLPQILKTTISILIMIKIEINSPILFRIFY